MVRGPHFEVARDSGMGYMAMKCSLKIPTWFIYEIGWLLAWAVFTTENLRLLCFSAFLLPRLRIVVIPLA